MTHKTLIPLTFLAAFLLSHTAFADEGFTDLALTISPWTATCRPVSAMSPSDCSIPQASGAPTAISHFKLYRATQAGQVGAATQDLRFGNMAAKLMVYSVYPWPAQGQPPYLQIQLELISPVRATCMASPKWQAGEALVPLICSGMNQNQRWGLTLVGKMNSSF